MTFSEPGIRPSKRATWRESNPRVLLQRIAKEHPKASEEELWKLFREELQDDEDYLWSAVRYCFDASMVALLRGDPPKSPAGPGRTARPSSSTTASPIEKRVEQEIQIKLLVTPMPNGKTLGQCTAPECARAGGWLAILAKKIPARKTVADVFTEQQLFATWKATK